ncbi:MAG TPA: type VI secretion system tip protein TssI/VgrG [Bryobacteraceae bacterium]|nr:type VI secretion system tip protein TssI/VgrG [Bryobacteraceae bacterium]
MSLLTDGPFTLETNLQDRDIHIRSFTGEEAVSKLFRFRLLVDVYPAVTTAQLLGQNVKFTVELRNEKRSFLATIAAVDELGKDEHKLPLYSLELVPRLWGLTQTVRSRVFEGLTPKAIINQVLESSGVRVNGNFRLDDLARPYCVQYFESDFDFVVRLLEEEGYIYLFEIGDGSPPASLFTITHFPSAFQELDPIAIPFLSLDARAGQEERISSWKKTRILTATTLRTRDHYFETNSPVLDGTSSVPSDPVVPGWETIGASWSASVDRYPGQWAHLYEQITIHGGETTPSGYDTFGNTRAKHELRQLVGATSASEGSSDCHRLRPGAIFDLVKHPFSSGKQFVVSVRHQGSRSLAHSTGGGHGFKYENQFTAVPYAGTMMYLPPRSTRKPLIAGCQTAKVVGATGANEIFTDKYGRVQVRFWWDRGAEPRSCWIRVATSWAGSNWGVQHIPRVGQEVVVTFLDGDPDRPLIVGSVYNPQHMPPFTLPANKTQSGIRTRSTEGGGSGESNEICFEDLKGSEEIYIHAQKDRTAIVENDSCEQVKNDRYDVVEKNLHAITGGEKRETITGKSSLTVGDDSMNAFVKNLGVRAGEIHLKAGKIVIEADAISIRTREKGREFIHLKKGEGITIDSKGQQVWVNCGGAGEPEDGCFTLPDDKLPDQPDNPFPDPDPDPDSSDDPCSLKN